MESKKEFTKEQIEKKAQELFNEDGYKGNLYESDVIGFQELFEGKALDILESEEEDPECIVCDKGFNIKAEEIIIDKLIDLNKALNLLDPDCRDCEFNYGYTQGYIEALNWVLGKDKKK